MPRQYTDATKISELAVALKARNACSKAMDWLDAKFSSSEANTTSMREALSQLPDESWIMWGFLKLGERIKPELRQVLLDNLTEPTLAFMLYLNVAWLTDEEDVLLEAKFKGKKPSLEKDLEDGVIKRAKNG